VDEQPSVQRVELSSQPPPDGPGHDQGCDHTDARRQDEQDTDDAATERAGSGTSMGFSSDLGRPSKVANLVVLTADLQDSTAES
jgi:hypothetical protein